MNHAESFIFPGTRSPQFWSPSRASLTARPVIQFAIEFLPRTRAHQIAWNRLLGLVVMVGVSASAWTSVGVALARWWK